MSTSRPIVFFAALLLAITVSLSKAETPHFGKPLDEAAIANWDISILPDGTGLPKGSGTSEQGAAIFAEKCAACHGDNGRGGGPAAALVEERKVVDISAAQKTIKNFWPYSTTIFDFIRRAMPFTAPRSLSDDEVYALTAYILSENKLIDAKDTMNAETLPKVKMPNRDNFIIRFPDRI
jgi:S-disulfanyl-L-cysteine oxidoreductase SoxD